MREPNFTCYNPDCQRKIIVGKRHKAKHTCQFCGKQLVITREDLHKGYKKVSPQLTQLI